MEILGRKIDAVQYENMPLITAYVRLKEGDCIKERKESYQCLNNCEKSLVIARFIDDKPFSVKALVPQELNKNSSLRALSKIRTLEGLESISKDPGYKLTNQNKLSILYFNNTLVATYIPCGMTTKKELFSKEVKLTIASLIERINEVCSLAESKPLEAVLDDKALTTTIFNPAILQIMQATFGKAGADLVQKLRLKKVERN